jgi:hypothetical protein
VDDAQKATHNVLTIVGKKLLNEQAEICKFCIRQKSQVRGSTTAA